MNTDLHSHTTNSDGFYSVDDILRLANRAGVKVMAITDHDIVTLIPSDKKPEGKIIIPGTEASTREPELLGSSGAHMTIYIGEFSKEILKVLEDTREGRTKKNYGSLKKLQDNEFNVSKKEFETWCTSKGYNLQNLNILHLTDYILADHKNIELISKISGKNKEEINIGFFITQFLRKTGEHSCKGYVETEDYEPESGEICGLVEKAGGIIAIAHPNFTFDPNKGKGGFEGLEAFIQKHKKNGLNGIEINTNSQRKWVERIIKLAKKYELFITFGSDDHGIESQRSKHGKIGQMNLYLERLGLDVLNQTNRILDKV